MDVESVDWALRTTRSVRRRLDWERPVEPTVIEECIEVATQAPTGVAGESWRFLVLTDAEPKAAIGRLYRQAYERYAASPPPGVAPKPTVRSLAERLHEAPALILVCAEGQPDPAIPAMQVAFYASVLPAAWSLMVALRTRGLGATWTTLHLLHREEAALALGIPDNVTQTVLLPVGYTKDARLRPAARRPVEEVTYWNAWGRGRD